MAALAVAAGATGNPAAPLVALLRERVAPRNKHAAAWLHRGLTSQDVVDTALMLGVRDSALAIRAELGAQASRLAGLVETHRATPMVARTLTQHAVPTTFGLKVAGWLTGVLDACEALDALTFPAQLGGAAGTRAASVELAAALPDPQQTAAALATRTTQTLGLHAADPWHTVRSPLTRAGDAAVTCTDAWGHLAPRRPAPRAPRGRRALRGVGRRLLDDAAQGQPRAVGAGAPRRTHHPAARRHPAPRRRLQRRRALRRRLARRVGDHAHPLPAYGGRRVPGHRAAVRPGVHADRMAANLDVLGRRRPVRAADHGRPGRAPPAGDYRGAADALVDRVLDRTRDLMRSQGARPISTPEEQRMIPHITAVRLTGRADRAELPLLVLGPSLGTSAGTLWAACADRLNDAFDVLAWDLPGHGHNRAVPDEPFTMAELAAGVLAVVDEVQHQRGDPGRPFSYAGDSVGGAVGLQLLLDAPRRVIAAALLCTGARIGDEAVWAGRIGQVSVSGTAVVVEGSAQRWFGPGFLEREPDVAAQLLQALQQTQDDGLPQVCGALAAFDVRDRLAEIDAPVLAVAGSHDAVTPPAGLREVADGVRDGRLRRARRRRPPGPGRGPARGGRPARRHFLGETGATGPDDTRTVRELYDAGMAVRREVLGDAHVDRATADATDLTRDFQQLITQYAWGGIWTRPGLDRRSRSLITLTALVARGHHEELALHLRAARDNGLTVEEIKELLLQTAIYCGVPDANTAFRIAQQTLADDRQDHTAEHPQEHP